MSDEKVNTDRRQFLVTAASVMGAAGAGAAAVPFVSSMSPSARAEAAGAPVEVDIGDLEFGQVRREQWRGQPVWILKRTPAELEALQSLDGVLRDPLSKESEQPDGARNPYRSLRPEIFVAVGLCTHLGCSPVLRSAGEDSDLGDDWKGGFFCPCHGSRFDLAGRVYKGVPAPRNLVIPPYRFADADTVVIGEEHDGGGA